MHSIGTELDWAHSLALCIDMLCGNSGCVIVLMHRNPRLSDQCNTFTSPIFAFIVYSQTTRFAAAERVIDTACSALQSASVSKRLAVFVARLTNRSSCGCEWNQEFFLWYENQGCLSCFRTCGLLRQDSLSCTSKYLQWILSQTLDSINNTALQKSIVPLAV